MPPTRAANLPGLSVDHHLAEQPEVPELGSSGSKGMPSYRFTLLDAGLKVEDTPLFYVSHQGTEARFHLTYNHQERSLPDLFHSSNVGPKWIHNWMSAVKVSGANPKIIYYCHPEGGTLQLDGSPGSGAAPTGKGWSRPAFRSGRRWRLLEVNGGQVFQVLHPDGSQEEFGPTQDAGRYLLAKTMDKMGNTTTLTYDSENRLIAVTDPMGKSMRMEYQWPVDPLKLSRVFDPHGRSCVLSYTGTGMLASITDMAGFTSSFSYGGPQEAGTYPADFLSAMTTPYGTTRFAMGETYERRWVQAIDPSGLSERVDYRQKAPGIAGSEARAPMGMTNSGLSQRNSFYFNKQAAATEPLDYTKARLYHWLLGPEGSQYSTPVLASEKAPLESRIWYLYPGQTDATRIGTSSKPSRTLRLLDDGTTQSRSASYTPLGKISRSTDAAGRVTAYDYSDDGLDLLQVRNLTGGRNETLATCRYGAQHVPQAITDAAGQTTTFTYDLLGHMTGVTNPKGERTILSYDGQGYLARIDRAMEGATTLFTHDTMGRLTAVTGPDGTTTAFDHDALDRPIKATYADGTSEEQVYDRLDIARVRDRSDRWTVMSYNALRQLEEVQDAAGRVARLGWCNGGGIGSLTDPRGRTTTWHRDLQGRIIKKGQNDDTGISYAYDLAGRMKLRTDAKGQITSYAYFPDDRLRLVGYANGQVATPSVRYTYDPDYGRLATMSDGTGTTRFAYHPIGPVPILGAGRLASVTPPMTHGMTTFAYDELGRQVSRSVDGIAETKRFDALGRLTGLVNGLGSFAYAYHGATDRISMMTFPNGQTTHYTYDQAPGPGRLIRITNLKHSGSNLSSFGYEYDPNGRISRWSAQADAQSPRVFGFQYDAVGQLLGATLGGPGRQERGEVGIYEYGYDLSGNRTSEQIDGLATVASFNALNQLVEQRASGGAP